MEKIIATVAMIVLMTVGTVFADVDRDHTTIIVQNEIIIEQNKLIIALNKKIIEQNKEILERLTIIEDYEIIQFDNLD